MGSFRLEGSGFLLELIVIWGLNIGIDVKGFLSVVVGFSEIYIKGFIFKWYMDDIDVNCDIEF